MYMHIQTVLHCTPTKKTSQFQVFSLFLAISQFYLAF